MLNISLNQLIINLGKYCRLRDDMQRNQDSPSGSMETNAGEAYQPLKSMSSPYPPGRDAGSIGRALTADSAAVSESLAIVAQDSMHQNQESIVQGLGTRACSRTKHPEKATFSRKFKIARPQPF